MHHTLLWSWSFEVLNHSFWQAQRAQETKLLESSQRIFAIWLSQLWLKYQTLFWNWRFEVLKTSKNILFDKRTRHKKHNFWTVHSESSQFDCHIFDKCITLYSEIEALKSSKRLKAFFFTSAEGTRNTAFRQFTANLRNLIVTSLIDASHFTLKLKLWSPQNV